jgi:DNA invertase Pin-like site-specific DNA recombinase
MLAIITRISRDRIDQVSIETQLQQGVKLAKKLGLQYKQYEEKQVSGSADIEDRKKLIELIIDIESGLITSIYCYDQSRLERSLETRIHFYKTLKKYNIDVYYETGIVGKDALSNLMGNLLSSFNQFTNELTSEKIKLALDYNVTNGKVHALPPYAYYKDENKKYAINEEQAEVIKEIYSLSLSGVGTNKIAEILNQRGIPTKYNLIGKGTLKTTNKKHKLKRLVTKNKADIKWSGNSVRGILYNKFYAGIRVFKGVEYEVPKIIDIDYWQLVNDNLKNNRNNSGKSVEHKYLLKGVLTCSVCNRNYYGRSRLNLKDNAYVCSSKRHKDLICDNRGINITMLDKLVWYYIENNEINYVIDYIQDNSTDNIINEKELLKTQLNNELKEVKKQYNNLISLVETGVVSAIDIKDRLNKNKDTENDIKIKIDNLSNEILILKSSVYDTIEIPTEVDFNSKKEIVNQLINNIEILFKDDFYYVRIYPVFNNIKFDLVYLEYVLTKSYKYQVTNVSYNNNLFKSVRFYSNKLSSLKSIKEL